MELRFLEGNFEHGKFKLQMREYGMNDWKDVPCEKDEKKWCEHITWRHLNGGSLEAYWILEPQSGKDKERYLCDAIKFCPYCGTVKP